MTVKIHVVLIEKDNSFRITGKTILGPGLNSMLTISRAAGGNSKACTNSYWMQAGKAKNWKEKSIAQRPVDSRKFKTVGKTTELLTSTLKQ